MGKADFLTYLREFEETGTLSPESRHAYAVSLLEAGSVDDFGNAIPIFSILFESCTKEDEVIIMKESACILARAYRLTGQNIEFFKIALKEMASECCSEVCYELGKFFLDIEDYQEATMWFYNAFYETESVLSTEIGCELAFKELMKCYEIIQKEPS